MFFASDNAGPVHPQILDTIIAVNQNHAMPYGNEPMMDDVRAKIRAKFEAPDAAVYLVATGTAANSLALATYCQPWQTVFCSELAHIQMDECGAPEFYSGGTKLRLVGTGAKMTPGNLHDAILRHPTGNVHVSQPGAVSITQVTEHGTLYSLEELRALTTVAKKHDLPVHLDGARFANAVAALGCTPAEMTWKAGVDVVSFGGTKNGCMGVEAVIFFDHDKAWEFELRRKRGAHLFSKHRFLSAQMSGYLENDLWLEIAEQANENMVRLAAGLRKTGVTFLHEPQANMLFTEFPRRIHQALHDAGAKYYVMSGQLKGDDPEELLQARLVSDWSLTHEQIDSFLAHF